MEKILIEGNLGATEINHPTFNCSKSTIKKLDKVGNMFKVPIKHTRTTSVLELLSNKESKR